MPAIVPRKGAYVVGSSVSDAVAAQGEMSAPFRGAVRVAASPYHSAATSRAKFDVLPDKEGWPSVTRTTTPRPFTSRLHAHLAHATLD